MLKYYIAPNGNDLAEGTKVNPFKTLKGAFRTIEANKANYTSDITIYLTDGEYFVDESDCLTLSENSLPQDVKVIVCAEGGATPIINAGRKITSWTQTQLNGNTVWKASLEKGLNGIYSLMVNGKAAELAKTIHQPFDGRNVSPQNSNGKPLAQGTFSWEYYDETDFAQGIVATNNQEILEKIVNPSQTHAVWLVEWKQFVIRLNDITNARLTSDYWGVIAKEISLVSDAQYYWPHPTHLFYLQNDISFIAKPGEFCYDKSSGDLYYYPREGERITNAIGEIPLTSHFIKMQGDAKNGAVRNITFQGLSFVNSAVDYIDEYGGFAVNQAQHFSNAFPKETSSDFELQRGMMGGAIYLEYSQNISFIDCMFQNLGLTAIVMEEGVQNCIIEGCVFKDLGNCAIRLSNSEDYIAKGVAQIKNNRICNNVIRRIGRINYSSPAILAHYVNGTEIFHNDIFDCPYTGISVGWGWLELPDSYAGNNKITHNKIGNYLMILKDGGGVYTLGNQPGSRIECNYFYSQKNAIAGLYLDEGTSGYTVRNNAVYLNDITDEDGTLLVADYCKEVPTMYWLHVNDASGKAGTAESPMHHLFITSNHYFISNGAGKTASHIDNLIPPILNDNKDEPQLRNVEYNSRESFLSAKEVQRIMTNVGVEEKYKCLLRKG